MDGWWRAARELGLAAFVASALGCGSSNGTPSDGGADAAFGIHRLESGADEEGADVEADASVAGTTGQPCTSNADCNGNACELTDPTPVCVVPGPSSDAAGPNCDPGDDGTLHFCDGSTLASSMVGPAAICLPFDNPPQTGRGRCLQGCTFATDGSPAGGCTGNNACNPWNNLYLQDTTDNDVVGLGYCGGGCMADADCQGPSKKCQIETGLCTSTLTTYPENPGDVCDVSPTEGFSTQCNCLVDQAGSGFCVQACVIGAAEKCPAGTVCDALEPNQFDDGTTGAPIAGFTKQNIGLAGACLPKCDLDADAGADADASGGDGGNDGAASSTTSCPATGICQDTTAAGVDCQP